MLSLSSFSSTGLQAVQLQTCLMQDSLLLSRMKFKIFGNRWVSWELKAGVSIRDWTELRSMVFLGKD